MPKFAKFLICLVLEVSCIYSGLMIGGWWPVRNVPPDQIWAGDGIGIFMFGTLGAIIGAAVGGVGIALFLSGVRRADHRRRRQVAYPGGVYPPPGRPDA